ncbi:MAG: hypothetical protein ABL927_13725 [Bdellovibrionales bacterium]
MSSKEFSLTEDSMVEALKEGCEEVTDNPNLKEWFAKEAIVLKTSDRYLRYVADEAIPKLKKASTFDGAEFKALGFGTSIAKLIEKQYCPKNKEASTCSTLSPTRLSDEILAIAENSEKSKSKADASESDGWQKEMCPVHFDIQYAEKRIKKEKEIGKISGVVDGNKLHELGSQIVTQKNQLSPWENNYKKKMKKDFDYKKCPEDLNTWKNVSE